MGAMYCLSALQSYRRMITPVRSSLPGVRSAICYLHASFVGAASSAGCALFELALAYSDQLLQDIRHTMVTASRHPDSHLVSSRFFHAHGCCNACWLRFGGVFTCLLSLATTGRSPLSGRSFQGSGLPSGANMLHPWSLRCLLAALSSSGVKMLLHLRLCD